MKLGACHKKKMVLEKEKKSKINEFLRRCIWKISSPPYSQKNNLKKILVYDSYQKRLDKRNQRKKTEFNPSHGYRVFSKKAP